MAHTSLDVAAKLLSVGHEKGHDFTPMQLIKLTYISHGWMLGLYNRSLFDDEIQAWKFGPVIPELYRAVRHFKNGAVSGIDHLAPAEFDEIELDLLYQVVEKYGHLSGVQLSHMTHRANTPWDIIWDPDGWSDVIPNDLIRAHYAGMAEQAQGRAECVDE